MLEPGRLLFTRDQAEQSGSGIESNYLDREET